MDKKVFGGLITIGLFVALGVFIFLMTNNKIVFGYNINYQPTQPIPYSHKLHAGKLKIDCKYCHTTTGVSRHASVPSLNICMNCHLTIKTDSPYIQKILMAYTNNEVWQWEKVHLLPDFVKFNHSAHIRAGKKCQTCHGNVQDMSVVYQKASLAMGWCVNCHRKPENNAPTTCGTCHY
ncbi:MAG: cytochrome C [Bdellovibrio sp.]|nr:MAG: cytochrome C [Bdellovibrio sp.]